MKESKFQKEIKTYLIKLGYLVIRLNPDDSNSVWPDLLIIKPNGTKSPDIVFFLELKVGKNKLTKNQKIAFFEGTSALNNKIPVFVIRNFSELNEILTQMEE